MDEKQLSEFVNQFVRHSTGLQKLSYEEAVWSVNHPEEAVDLWAEAVKKHFDRVFKRSPEYFCQFMRLKGEVKIPKKSQGMRQSVKEAFSFLWGEGYDSSSRLDRNFAYRFWEIILGTRNTGTKLYYHDIEMDMDDDNILEALYGKPSYLTFSASFPEELLVLMHWQLNGKEASMLVDGGKNVFFMKDAQGDSCVVLARFVGNRWHVAVEDHTSCGGHNDDRSCTIEAGSRVFSRPSKLEKK